MAKALKFARQKAKMSTGEVAVWAGCKQSIYEAWESGERMPTLYWLRRIGFAMKLSPYRFIQHAEAMMKFDQQMKKDADRQAVHAEALG